MFFLGRFWSHRLINFAVTPRKMKGVLVFVGVSFLLIGEYSAKTRYLVVAYFNNCALIMRIKKRGIVLYLDSSS